MQISCPFCNEQNIQGEFCPRCGSFLGNQTVNTSSDSGENDVAMAQFLAQRNESKSSEYEQIHSATDRLISRTNSQINKSGKANSIDVIGLIVGIAFIIIGFVTIGSADINRFNKNYNTIYNEGHLSDIEFGGDFYTEAYNGIRECEKDLFGIGIALVKLIKAIGILICGVGAFLSFTSLVKIKNNLQR